MQPEWRERDGKWYQLQPSGKYRYNPSGPPQDEDEEYFDEDDELDNASSQPDDLPQPDDVTKGWKDDPLGRYDYRYWDGDMWTSKVSLDDEISDDPIDSNNEEEDDADNEEDISNVLSQPDDITKGWKDDPLDKYDYRYWDGSKWTSKVSLDNEISDDPIDYNDDSNYDYGDDNYDDNEDEEYYDEDNESQSDDLPQPDDVTKGWKDDPLGRYDYRYWDGDMWTSKVSSNEKIYDDPLDEIDEVEEEEEEETVEDNDFLDEDEDEPDVPPPSPRMVAPQRQAQRQQSNVRTRREYISRTEEVEGSSQRPKDQRGKTKSKIVSLDFSSTLSKLQSLNFLKKIAIISGVVIISLTCVKLTGFISNKTISPNSASAILTATTQSNSFCSSVKKMAINSNAVLTSINTKSDKFNIQQVRSAKNDLKQVINISPAKIRSNLVVASTPVLELYNLLLSFPTSATQVQIQNLDNQINTLASQIGTGIANTEVTNYVAAHCS